MKKKSLWSLLTIVVVAMLSVVVMSCSKDDEDDVIITENEIVGTWILYNDTQSVVYSFYATKKFNVIFGSNVYAGQWKLEGSTIHNTTDDMDEYLKFTDFQKGKGEAKKGKGTVKYQNSKGTKYTFTAEKSSDETLFK